MTAPEVNLSDLLNKPKDTLSKLQRARSLRVHRRAADEEDLVLTTSSRAEQADEAASATTRLFLALMKHNDQARALVTEVVPEAFPWVRFLPREDVHAFVVELVDTLEGAEALNNPAPVAQVIASWRHTAEVYADPELLAVLRRDSEDFGPVPAPGAADG